MSVVLMLHADEADCFLTCRLCNLCLKINQRFKAIKDKKCNLEGCIFTDRDRYIRCNSG